MRFVEVLCEGSSDVPAVEEILRRRFKLRPDEHFRIHPHAGKGKLPKNYLAKPAAQRRGLLDQLPAKLRAYGRAESDGYTFVIVVLVDADDEDCRKLKKALTKMYAGLPSKPTHILFRIAVEETESWFIADTDAIKAAYPEAKIGSLKKIGADAVCGAWERLGESLGRKASECNGADKVEWARAISPHLELAEPKSPSLSSFVTGLEARLR